MVNELEQTVNVHNGVASLQVDTSNLPLNEYTITARFTGTDNYKPATATALLTINNGLNPLLYSLNYGIHDYEDIHIIVDFAIGNTEIEAYRSYDGGPPADPEEEFISNYYGGYFLAWNGEYIWMLDFNNSSLNGPEVDIPESSALLDVVTNYSNNGNLEYHNVTRSFPPRFEYSISEGELLFELDVEEPFDGDVSVFLVLYDGEEIYSAYSSGFEDLLQEAGGVFINE